MILHRLSREGARRSRPGASITLRTDRPRQPPLAFEFRRRRAYPYHGVLAPRARWRSRVVSYDRPALNLTAHAVDASPRGAGTPGAWTWAALMRRVFDLDVLACPRCGGRLRVIATVQDPLAVQAILAHLGRSLSTTEAPGPAPPVPAASS